MIARAPLPGFRDPVHGAQATFRAILAALAEPGTHRSIDADVTAPPDLYATTAAAALALFDLDVRAWLDPRAGDSARAWLRFHTNCTLASDAASADMLVALDGSVLDLGALRRGTTESPEESATVLVQCASDVESGITLTGPGILGERRIAACGVPRAFWTALRRANADFPRGIDVLLFDRDGVIGVPRSTALRLENG